MTKQIPLVIALDIDQALELLVQESQARGGDNSAVFNFLECGYEPDGNAWIASAADFTGEQLALLLLAETVELAWGTAEPYESSGDDFPEFGPDVYWAGFESRGIAYVIPEDETKEDESGPIITVIWPGGSA